MDKMKIPTIERSFFRCSLRTGSLLIVYYGLFSGMFMSIMVIGWSSYNHVFKEVAELLQALYISKDAIIWNIALSLLVGIAGLYGIYQDNVHIIGIYLAIHLIGFFFQFVTTYHCMEYHEPPLVVVTAWIMLIIQSYMIVVLYSFFRQRWEQRTRTTQTQNGGTV